MSRASDLHLKTKDKSYDTTHELAMDRAPAIPIETPMSMLGRAVESGASMEVLEKLMGLQERWEANQARKAFDAAIAEAKANIDPVIKNRQGHNAKKYADFAAIAKAVDPVLSKHGLSYRFRTKQDDLIRVTCVLSHKAGHSEETTLAGPADATGSKNAIQAIGSTLTYLQRYSLMQALGVAAAEDDDGQAAGAGGTITEQQLNVLQTLIDEFGADVPRLCRHYKIEKVADLPASKYQDAKEKLSAKRQKKVEAAA
jgi:hypothetical protein